MPDTRAVLYEYTAPHDVHYNDDDEPDASGECYCFRENMTLTRYGNVHFLTLSDGEPFGNVVSIKVDAAILSALIEEVNHV